MKVLSATWNSERDSTKIVFCNDFKQSDWLVKADVLRDLIGLLQHQYDCLFDEQDWKKRNNYQFDTPHPSDV